MSEMAEMTGMGLPANTLPMMQGDGPYGPLEMGGMFTVVKIREKLKNYTDDPGWYRQPEGTQAWKSGEAPAPGESAGDHPEHQH